MPRKARKDSQSCFYHVIVQGINKEYIFDKNEFMEYYKKIILEKLQDEKIKILAYCIMNNHTHFLIYTERSIYLSKYMQKVNTKYSNYYNRIKNRVGYVFRDRFYSQNIINENQLFNCLKYIHMNPVKANIVKTMNEYKYSSYNEYLYKREIIDGEGIKLIFGENKKYKEEFIRIHNENKDFIEEDFFDIKEKDITRYISELEEKYEKNILELKDNKEQFKNILKDARKQTNVTIAELARIFDVSHSTIWNYLKK